jgi:predicted nucleotidyltransferase
MKGNRSGEIGQDIKTLQITGFGDGRQASCGQLAIGAAVAKSARLTNSNTKVGLTGEPNLGTIAPIMGSMSGTKTRPIGASLFGATRQAVLSLFFSHPDQRYYQRQVIRMIGLGSGAVQRDLEHLTSAGVLTRTIDGRQIYYQSNPKSPVFNELRGLIRKTFGIAEVLRSGLATVRPQIRVAFVYGSVATGSETSASDIDLMIVGDDISLEMVVSALVDTQAALGREVNPSVYSAEDFCRKLAHWHHFLSNVLQGPKLFIIGDESELEGLAKKRVAKRAQDKPRRNQRSLRHRRQRP